MAGEERGAQGKGQGGYDPEATKELGAASKHMAEAFSLHLSRGQDKGLE